MIVHIEWDYGKGRMNICADNFFPCGIVRFRKLLKIINLDWEHKHEILQQLHEYFTERKIEYEVFYKMEQKSKHKRGLEFFEKADREVMECL